MKTYRINNKEIKLIQGISKQSYMGELVIILTEQEAKINELIIALGTHTPETKNLIGKKIKGFKFKDNDTCTFWNSMNHYVGKIGVIIDVTNDNYKVEYKEDMYAFYPASEIEKHILPDDYVEWSVAGLKDGDEYFCVNDISGINKCAWHNRNQDIWRKATNNIFQSEQEAIDYKDKMMST